MRNDHLEVGASKFSVNRLIALRGEAIENYKDLFLKVFRGVDIEGSPQESLTKMTQVVVDTEDGNFTEEERFMLYGFLIAESFRLKSLEENSIEDSDDKSWCFSSELGRDGHNYNTLWVRNPRLNHTMVKEVDRDREFVIYFDDVVSMIEGFIIERNLGSPNPRRLSTLEELDDFFDLTLSSDEEKKHNKKVADLTANQYDYRVIAKAIEDTGNVDLLNDLAGLVNKRVLGPVYGEYTSEGKMLTVEAGKIVRRLLSVINEEDRKERVMSCHIVDDILESLDELVEGPGLSDDFRSGIRNFIDLAKNLRKSVRKVLG